MTVSLEQPPLSRFDASMFPPRNKDNIIQVAFELLINWSDGRVVMALVSGSPEMSLLVRNRVGSNPTLISISFAHLAHVLLRTRLFFCSVGCAGLSEVQDLQDRCGDRRAWQGFEA